MPAAPLEDPPEPSPPVAPMLPPEELPPFDVLPLPAPFDPAASDPGFFASSPPHPNASAEPSVVTAKQR
jgi:hypothetical protein